MQMVYSRRLITEALAAAFAWAANYQLIPKSLIDTCEWHYTERKTSIERYNDVNFQEPTVTKKNLKTI